MKKIWKSHLLALLLCLSMVLPFLPETVQAADDNSNYVALGDSITTGYGLADSDSNFATILAGSDLILKNLANDGETSEQLAKKLSTDSTYRTAVENAELITLSIGGNDLMNALYNYLADKTGLSAADVRTALEDPTDSNRNSVLGTAMLTIKDFAQSAYATEAVAMFAQNFTTIVNVITNLNPNAMIVVLNQYNPYGYLDNNPAVLSVVEAFEQGVASLNTIFATGAQTGAYVVADVYNAFENADSNPCNAYFNSQTDLSLDFHPNTDGHQLIANTIEKLDLLNHVTASGDTYDRNGFEDVTYTYSCSGSAEFTELQLNGTPLTKDKDYSVFYGNRVVIEEEYLNELLEQGELHEGSTLKLTFRFSEGNSVTKSLFIPETYKVTVNCEPYDDWGYFAANGYSDSSTNVYYAAKGEEVYLEAIPYLNYTFDCWKLGDDVLSEEAGYIFTPDSDITLTMLFSPAPCYLELSPAELDFGVVDVTYDQPDARTVTITNVGENAAVLIIPPSENYVVDELSEHYLDPGSSATFTVRPAANLAKGTYNESIAVYTISADIPQPMSLSLEDEEELIELPEEAMIAAELKVSFQVGKDSVVQTDTNEQSPKTEATNVTPRTGDTNHIFNWLLLLVVSGIAIETYFVINKKRKTNR